jgi:hypothetical protein
MILVEVEGFRSEQKGASIDKRELSWPLCRSLRVGRDCSAACQALNAKIIECPLKTVLITVAMHACIHPVKKSTTNHLYEQLVRTKEKNKKDRRCW